MELNMVPYKFFQQLLKDLKDPQPNAIRDMHKGMEMITAELTTYPLVYTTQKGMGTILKQH